MDLTPLPYRAPIDQYQSQAAALLDGWRAGDRAVMQTVRSNLPKLLRVDVPWLAKQMSEDDIRATPIDLADTQLALARWYTFQNWERLVEYVEAVRTDGSPVHRFESAVEAVVGGDAAGLESMLGANPDLVRARSTRVTPHDPPEHRATLLHYVAANGVEGHRQKSPANSVEIARTLLEAGAEADALAGMYGGQCTTMSMLVSSEHPAKAGVQVPLVHTLVDYGAAVDGRGEGEWVSPLNTALVFGYLAAAKALVTRGARVDSIVSAAGLGLVDDVRQMLPEADPERRHRALAISALLGQTDVVRVLLDAGEDPNRFNPDGMHSHGTPLHHAACGGHDATVRLLVEHGARLDIKDLLWEATPLGWAEYCGQPGVAEYLRARG